MKQIFCPKCGTINRPYAKYCRHCGFNLDEYKRHQKILNSNNSFLNHPKQQPQSKPVQHSKPIPPRQNPEKHHHIFAKVVCIMVLLLAILMAGAYISNKREEASNNNSASQATSQASQPSQNDNSNNDSYDDNENSNDEDDDSDEDKQSNHSSSDYKPLIKSFWSNVCDKLDTKYADSRDSDNDSFTGRYIGNVSGFFKNSTDNSSYDGIKDWINLIIKADSNNDTKPLTIKPYDFESNGNGDIHYKVYYDFRLKSGVHHIQIFKWNAVVKSNKIVKMNSQREPIKDYKE